MTWLWVKSFGSTVLHLQWPVILDCIKKIVEIVAIITGGVWTYYRFIRGRIYHPRLESAVHGRAFAQNGTDYLIASFRLKNLGNSKTSITNGSGLRLFSCDLHSVVTPPDEPRWTRLATFPVFAKHGWIESGETISDEILCALPPNQIAIKLELRICGHKIEWNTKTVIEISVARSGKSFVSTSGNT